MYELSWAAPWAVKLLAFRPSRPWQTLVGDQARGDCVRGSQGLLTHLWLFRFSAALLPHLGWSCTTNLPLRRGHGEELELELAAGSRSCNSKVLCRKWLLIQLASLACPTRFKSTNGSYPVGASSVLCFM